MSLFTWLQAQNRKWDRRPAHRPAQAQRHICRPRLELLEDRLAPATFTVSTAADSGAGSLRQAILDSNSNPGPNTIQFDIATSGVQTVAPQSPLPAVTHQVTIDGTSEPGYSGSPVIVLDGSNAGLGADGLTITAGSCMVEGLAIVNFGDDGILITGAQAISNTLVLNYLGTRDGMNPSGNGNAGVEIANGAASNSIGPAFGAGNVISGNQGDGVLITGAYNNFLAGNHIGTTADGKLPLGNNKNGVDIAAGANFNTIWFFNVISGNALDGVLITDSNFNSLYRNHIGTTADGTAALGNGQNGVELSGGASENNVGRFNDFGNNVISGNGNDGVLITGSGTAFNSVTENFIGTSGDGSQPLPNANGLIIDEGANNNTIFFNQEISGNLRDGVGIFNDATDNMVTDNQIGTRDYAHALPNRDGVIIDSGANSNTIDGNLISGNLHDGIGIFDGATGNQVLGNLIGITTSFTPDGTPVTTALPNYQGIEIKNGADNNTIGGSSSVGHVIVNGRSVGEIAGAGNLISGNTNLGLSILNASGNLVQGNWIGTDITGTTALPNDPSTVRLDGLDLLDGASGNTIGGASSLDANGNLQGLGNLISGNGFDGVFIADYVNANNLATSNLVEGNFIGTDVTGTKALPNEGNGVHLEGGAENNTIGGTTPDLANLISGNGSSAATSAYPIVGAGVQIADFFGFGPDTRNVVEGNKIGTDVSGTRALGNLYQGVSLQEGGSNNTIGGASQVNSAGQLSGAGNVISANPYQDVLIYQSSGNAVQGNFIGTDVTGTQALGTANDGVDFYASASGNTIGGASSLDAKGRLQGLGNLISGNGQSGVALFDNVGPPLTGNVLQGNFIGTNVTGTQALPNGRDGVEVASGVTGTLIGGTAPGTGNLISGNGNIAYPGSGGGIEIGPFFSGTVTTGTLVQGNFIGTDITGMGVLPNQGSGVLIENGASANTIGGSSSVDPSTGKLSGAGNLISGNLDSGVQINQATGNFIQGNFIGTDVTGEVALGNALGTLFDNVDLFNGASNNTIGGASSLDATGNLTGLGNLISGDSTGTGVWITNAISDFVTPGNPSSNNLVEGNFIGTDAKGNTALSDVNALVLNAVGSDSSTVANNTIGGLTTGTGNLLNGNIDNGTRFPSLVIGGAGAMDNLVEGNLIGTNAAGTAALGTASNGIVISRGANNNTIGGTTAGARNTISGNTQNGVYVTGSGTTANVVEGNYIGTDITGTVALANGNDGVHIQDGASRNIIGAAGAGNVISGNANQGVLISGSGTSGNVLQGNFIGTTAEGAHALANLGVGVYILNGATGNTVGTVGAGNVISGNNSGQGGPVGVGVGVLIQDGGTNGNLLLGNFIGTTADGSHPLGNTYGVVLLDGPSNNTIGAPGAGNVISGNLNIGVELLNFFGSVTSGNVIQGNFIGTTADGTQALGNGVGLAIFDGASGNTVGGTVPGAGNVISANGLGVWIAGSRATGNQVLANFIGTTADGTQALGNGTGVQIDDGASGNTVGAAGAGNIIAFNTGEGVVVIGASSLSDAILGNAIFGNAGLGIDLGNDGVTLNTPGGPHVGPNRLQNYPILYPYATPGLVTGTLNSAPNSTFHIEIFASPAGDPSGHGQGRDLLGSLTVTTDPLGNASFTFSFGPFPGEPILSATATDAAGDTSEFSPWVDAALTASGTTLSAAEGASFTGVVATFADADPAGLPGDYAAIIQWGDGSTSSGMVLRGPGGFAVFGSHTYAKAAALVPVTVSITDLAGQYTATAYSLAGVADAALAGAGQPVGISEGQTFTNVPVADFTDTNPAGAAADYTATITWGDGTASPGTVAPDGHGGFTVSSTHAYDEEGSYAVLVSIRDQGGSTLALTTTAAVAAVAPTAGLSGPAGGVPGQPRTFTLTAASPSAADTAAGLVYTVNWGDGSVQTRSRTPGDGAGIALDHVYTAAGSYLVQVSATDDGGLTSAAVTQAVTVQTAEYQSGTDTLAVGGTLGNDTVILSPADAAGDINVNLNGKSAGNFKPTSHLLVYSQAGNDTIQLASTKIKGTTYYVAVPAYLYGGGVGTDKDTLDARGSTANNVLIGGAGSNVLYGGLGRDLLIAGRGASQLRAGPGQDILVGGWTDYDLDSTAMTYDRRLAGLDAIMREWGRTDLGSPSDPTGYLARVSDLLGPASGGTAGGLNGPFFLNPNTVHSNGHADTLDGAASPALDWFFADSLDVVKNTRSGEVVSPL
jgi:hypothetical protein